MNAKTTLRKAAAFALCAIMLMGVMPPVNVSANAQMQIQNLNITFTPAPAGAYGYTMSWQKPLVAAGTTPVDEHPLASYYIYRWNTSRNEVKPPAAQETYTPSDMGNPSVSLSGVETTLEPGSIYRYQVVPVHSHIVTLPGGGTTTALAPMDGTYPPAEALLLTDLRVEASGAGKRLTVTWDNPLYDGREIFSGFKIYYMPYSGDSAAKIVTEPEVAPTVTVLMNDPGLIRAGNKLTYAFDTELIQQGKMYAVAVEPIYNGVLLRRNNTTKATITENQRSLQVAFSDREYRTNNAYVKPSLYAEEIGQAMLRLYWDSFATSTLSISSLKLYESNSADFTNATEIGTYRDTYAKNAYEFETARPETVKYYKMVVTYRQSMSDPLETMESEIVIYYPDYQAFRPTKPNVLEIKDPPASPISMELIWEAFARAPYSTLEELQAVGGYFIDKDIEYDIWVTDSLANMEDPLFENFMIEESLSARDLPQQAYPLEDVTKQAYSRTVQYFYARGESGYELRPLEDNKLYYVRIVARRTASRLMEASRPAYASHFIMPKGSIATRPPVVSKPPLRIKTVNDIEQITTDSITIQWDLTWFEIYDKISDAWYPEVSIVNNLLYFGDKITQEMRTNGNVLSLHEPKYQLTDNLQANKNAITDIIEGKMTTPPDPALPLRLMSLKDAKYEIHVAEADYLYETTYADYLTALPEDAWETITATGDPKHPDYMVTNVHAPQAGALAENTSYVILFRPYVVLADGKKAAYQPAAVVATTLKTRLDPEITPVVPVLDADSAADTSVTVRFPYLDGLEYELAWSELLSDYPDGGQTIANADIVANGVVMQSGASNKTMYYMVNGLFPETTYYLWIRSIGVANGNRTESGWSNPISMTTLTINPPGKPQGLGLAAENHIDTYNKENSDTLLPVDAEYMHISWLRDIFDPETGDGTIEGNEFSSLLSSPSFTGIYIVKFDGLIGNHPYYVRAKTRLSISKAGAGTTASYQYIVQFAPEADFMDAIEVIVGTAPAGGEAVVFAESGWCEVVRIYTKQHKGEYDGERNPDMYPMPESDFEITYDSKTSTLTYRFRSTGKDALGNADNMADQRFITRMLAEGMLSVDIDMTGFMTVIPKNRVLQLPYTIVRAMETNKIPLVLKANATTYSFAPGFVNTAQLRSLTDYGTKAQITITVNDSATLPIKNGDGFYANTPQKLSVTAQTPTGAVSLTSVAKPITLTMRPDNRSVAYDNNVGAYFYATATVGWTALPGKYDSGSNSITTSTAIIGSYSVLAKTPPRQTGTADADSNNAAYVVNSAVHFTDVKTYNPNSAVTSAQLNKIIAALAANSRNVAVNDALTDAERNALTKAGMLVQSNTRQEAVSALVKLYETKTRYAVQNVPMLAQSPYTDIRYASPSYQVAMLKAGVIGFYGDAANASPNTALLFKDLMLMLDLIVEDAGL